MLSSSANIEGAPLFEAAKCVLEYSSQLEVLQSSMQSSYDFFSPHFTALRSKLRNACLKLWTNPQFRLEYYRKAEEILWRRLYHDIYKFCKSNRNHNKLSTNESLLIEAHFVSGIGFYSSLIIKLRLKHNLQDPGRLIMPLGLSLWPTEETPFEHDSRGRLCQTVEAISRTNSSNELSSATTVNGTTNDLENSETLQEWSKNAIYRCLVYMGDLSRYLIEPTQPEYHHLAVKFYRAASLYNQDYGLPFNQLATMVGNENYALDAICNYMRCCLRSKPFEGAEGNMRRTFAVNARLYDDMCRRATTVSVTSDPVYVVKKLIVTFIKLAADLWSGVTCAPSRFPARQQSIASLIHSFFELLVEALEFKSPYENVSSTLLPRIGVGSGGAPFQSETSKPCYITTTIMSQFADISLMLIARAQSDIASPGACIIYDSTVALTLNLLHYAATRCRQTILSKLSCIQNDQNNSSRPTTQESHKIQSETQHFEGTLKSNADCQDQQPIDVSQLLSTHRSPSSMVDELAESDASECMSELEETALSTIDALEISSDMSETYPREGGRNLIDLDSDEDKSLSLIPHRNQSTRSNIERDQPNSVASTSEVTACSHHELMNFVYTQTYLPTIKILCDWLQSNSDIINLHATAFSSFFKEFDSLLDSINRFEQLASMADSATNRQLQAPLNLDDVVVDEYEGNHVETYEHWSKRIQRYTFSGPTWIQRYPLSVDYTLMTLKPLKLAHEKNIDFNSTKELSVAEMGYLCIQCVIAFASRFAVVK